MSMAEKGAPHRSLPLSRHMAAIMRSDYASRVSDPLPGRSSHSLATRALVYSSMALLSLGPIPVAAVGFGDIQLRSGLGEPMRATVPLRLAPGEAIAPSCVATGGLPRQELTSPPNLTARAPTAVGPAVVNIELATSTALYEPMYEVSLRVDCSGLPTLVRQYVVMLDVPGVPVPLTQAPTESPQSLPLSTPANRAATRTGNPARTARLVRSREPIAAGRTYRVRNGDTLSTIAARVDGRPANFTWKLADLIFAANPDAFIRNNPNLIKLGARLQIPGPAQWSGTSVTRMAQGPNDATLASQPAPAAPASTPLPPAAIANSAPADSNALAAPGKVSAPAETSPAVATASNVATESAQNARPVARPVADSPFVDDQPAPAEPGPVAAVVEPGPVNRLEAPVSLAPPVQVNAEPDTSAMNPLLAILFGVLIGFGVSAALLRGRLIAGLASLLRGRRTDAQDSGNPAVDDTFADTDEWLPNSGKTDAFLTDELQQAEPIAVGPPEEQTYVVEVSEAEESAALTTDPNAAARTEAAEATRTADAAEPFAPSADDSAHVLAELFDDGLGDLPAETDLPEEVFIADDGDMPNELAPTAELPHFNSRAEAQPDMELDPTAEMGALDSEEDDAAATAAMDELSPDDTRLSETLREALSLLESDYQSEMTASQIIDQEALSSALEQEGAARRKTGSGS